MYGPVHIRFIAAPLAWWRGAIVRLFRYLEGPSMKSLAVLIAAAVVATSLSGCIVYVSPDHHTRYTPPAADEKPAPVDEKPAPTTSSN